MLKKFELRLKENTVFLYATDDVSEALSYKEKGEAVLLVVEDIYNAPFVSGIKYVTDNLDECDESYFKMVYARQKQIPLNILETKRTIVREIAVADLPELYEIYDDDEVRRFMEPLYEYEEEKEFTINYIENVYSLFGYGLWVVFDKESRKMIGRAGINIRNIDGEDKNELGYLIRKEFRNKGLAYEICDAIIEYANNELDIDELFIVTEKDNVNSLKLAEKLGFVLYDEVVMDKKMYKLLKKG